MFLILALFTFTPNLEGLFFWVKILPHLICSRNNVLNLKFFCFLISTLKEHMSLHVYKYWFEPEIVWWVLLFLRLKINYPEFRRYHQNSKFGLFNSYLLILTSIFLKVPKENWYFFFSEVNIFTPFFSNRDL